MYRHIISHNPTHTTNHALSACQGLKNMQLWLKLRIGRLNQSTNSNVLMFNILRDKCLMTVPEKTRYDYNLTIMKSPKPAIDNRFKKLIKSYLWNRTMLNLCGIVVAILKMATGRNFSMSGINSGHHNLPTYQMTLKSENVEFVAAILKMATGRNF